MALFRQIIINNTITHSITYERYISVQRKNNQEVVFLVGVKAMCLILNLTCDLFNSIIHTTPESNVCSVFRGFRLCFLVESEGRTHSCVLHQMNHIFIFPLFCLACYRPSTFFHFY